MYEPSLKYRRTPAQRTNLLLSWKRSDKAFFASGACHILAFTFASLHPNEGYRIIFIRPVKDYSGTHLYVTNGTWAFDFNGWTKERELLEVVKKSYRKENPKWDYKRIVIKVDMETFCKKNDHRPPAYFAHLPWERVYRYIKRFSSRPPLK